MTRRLLLSYLTLTTFVLVILEVPLGTNFSRNERKTLIADVQRDALVLATYAEEALESGTRTDVTAIIARYRTQTGGRVVIVNLKGRSIADSDPAAKTGRDFSTRPEIARALEGHLNAGMRHSETLKTDLVYAAVPVASGGVVHGAVRITYPASELAARVRRNWTTLGLIALIVLAAATLVGWLLARSIAAPLRSLEDAAEKLADGDLATRAPDRPSPAELRSLSRTFNSMAERLQTLVDSQRAFVADASHQLRTPLTALRLRLENLEPGASDAEREDLDGAIREAWRLSDIVDELLLLARAEGAPPERHPLDVAEILDDRASAWGPLAEERGVALTVEHGHGAANALAAGGHLEQILDNYLSNALDAAPSGSALLIRADRRGDWIEVHVVDAGPGMDADARAHAFDRFWRGDAGRARGSGLGLAIVRRLARASGGEVELHEASGGGIDAVVRLEAAE